jgi:hypothetical protein
LPPRVSGTELSVDADDVAVLVEELDLGVGDGCSARDLVREHLARVAPRVRNHDTRELLAAHVAHEPLRRGVQPADHAAGIDDVAGDVDLQRITPLASMT